MSSVHLRLASRVCTALRVDWNVVGKRARIVSALENMSVGGVYVRTPTPAPAGAHVQLRLLTDGGIVPTLGRVVRVAHDGMGVRFVPSDTVDVPFEVPIDEIDIA
ncbi:MAG: PilZ domain-containing protein [Polyangiaceae bacterium]|nr:PilZ domain-containing protein [Polyangiaceae bacterium]